MIIGNNAMKTMAVEASPGMRDPMFLLSFLCNASGKIVNSNEQSVTSIIAVTKFGDYPLNQVRIRTNNKAPSRTSYYGIAFQEI